MELNPTLYYASGSEKTFQYSVDITFGAYTKHSKSEMVIRWLELWLLSHCRSDWRLEAWENNPHTWISNITISFRNPKEAIYFKLSPEYVSEVSEFKKVA